MVTTATKEVLGSYETIRRKLPFKVKFDPKDAPAGSTVVLRGNFDADFDSGRDTDRNLGWQNDHAMTLKPDGYYHGEVDDLIVGETYEYKYFITRPDGTTLWKPSGKNETVKVDAESKISPSPTEPVEKVQTSLKAAVKQIITGGKTLKGAEGLAARFDALKTTVDRMGIKEDLTERICNIFAELIREDKNVPEAIKGKFPKGDVITNFNELERRLQEGKEEYRHLVFDAIVGDEKARDFFHLKPNTPYNDLHPFHDAAHNALFNRICSERDLGALAPRIGVALNSIVNVPDRNPALDLERSLKLDEIVGALTVPKPAKGKKLWEGIDPKWKTVIGDLLLKAGEVGIMYGTGLWWPFMLKGAAEYVSGVSSKDVLEAIQSGHPGEHLWEIFANNNVAAKDRKRKDPLDILRMVPYLSALSVGQSIGDHAAKAHGSSHAPSHTPGSTESESLMRKAAQEALNL